tara:strand:+ start:180 stop:308 length:129 start_codon:yes stop_codon:yes gene_type:complete
LAREIAGSNPADVKRGGYSLVVKLWFVKPTSGVQFPVTSKEK